VGGRELDVDEVGGRGEGFAVEGGDSPSEGFALLVCESDVVDYLVERHFG